MAIQVEPVSQVTAHHLALDWWLNVSTRHHHSNNATINLNARSATGDASQAKPATRVKREGGVLPGEATFSLQNNLCYMSYFIRPRGV